MALTIDGLELRDSAASQVWMGHDVCHGQRGTQLAGTEPAICAALARSFFRSFAGAMELLPDLGRPPGRLWFNDGLRNAVARRRTDKPLWAYLTQG